MVEGFDCTTIDLRYGGKGELVTRLQTHLKTLGYYTTYNGHNLKIDGEYLTYTEWAVKKFQKDTGHSQDGWFGPKTCKSLNEKIGATSDSSSSSGGGGTENESTTPNATSKEHVIKNVFTKEESNLHIGGVNLIATSVTPTNHYHNGNWKTVELSDDTHYPYKGHKLLREYSVECYLTHKQFKTLEYDLYLIGDTFSEVVSDTIIPAGKYMVNISIAEERVMEKKLTIKLTEAQGV